MSLELNAESRLLCRTVPHNNVVECPVCFEQYVCAKEPFSVITQGCIGASCERGEIFGPNTTRGSCVEVGTCTWVCV